MESFLLILAALVVLGGPALAAASWRRAQDAPADMVEIGAVAYGGIAVASLSTWLVAELAGLSWRVMALAPFLGAAVLIVPALATRHRSALSTAGRDAPSPPAGHPDDRMSPGLRGEAGVPDPRAVAPPAAGHFAVLAAAGAFFALLAYLPFLDYGWVRPDGVHRMAMTDWYKHLVTTTALTSSSAFPPANPFLHTAGPAPYYYGFHLLGASIARLAGGLEGPEAVGRLVFPALLTLTVCTAWATPIVVYTAARTMMSGWFDIDPRDGARAALLAALGATFLAGFDLIPLFLDTVTNVATKGFAGGGMSALRGAIPSTHLDYWIHHNERQFNAPYLTTIWAPQHMAGVLVALLAVHLVLQRRLAADERGDVAIGGGSGWLLPALLLAGLPGLSAYVALGLAAGVSGALVVESISLRLPPWRTTAWRIWWLPASAAALVALPVAVVLSSGAGPGLVVHVSDAGRWVNGAVFSSLFGAHWLTGLLDTFAVYVVEFGVLGLLAFFEIRRASRAKRLLPHQRHVANTVVAMMVVVTFVRPPVGGPNNLYARPLVLAWCLLAPFAAVSFARATANMRWAGANRRRDPTATPDRRRGMRLLWPLAAVAVCLFANAYALLGVVLEGALFWATPAPTVEVARWINGNAPAGAVVAVAPDDFISSFGYWLRRPLALADERHALLFGASAAEYARSAADLRRGVAAGGEPAADAVDALGATLLVISRAPEAGIRLSTSPCFEQVHANEAWLVFARADAGCASGR